MSDNPTPSGPLIIRRLAEAARRQDWFVVVLELLIVVVGIFIGLQVDEWNQARKAQAREAVYLDLLRADVMQMHAELSERMESTELQRDRMISALRALESCDASPESLEDIGFALERYQVIGPLTYLGATYDEMVATGSLARIEDVALKQAVANSFSRLEKVNEVIRSFRISLAAVDQIVWRNVSFGRPDDRGRVMASFDVDKLCTDLEMRNAVAEMIDVQADALSTHRRAMTTLETLMALLQKS